MSDASNGKWSIGRKRTRNATAATRAAAVRRAVAEAMECRLLFDVTTLSGGTGDGAASVTVDAFGAFGVGASPAGDLFYDVAGAGGAVGTVFQSALYMSAAGDGGDFLAEADLGRGTGNFNPLGFDSTDGTTATSTFNVGIFTVVLTQTLFATQGTGSAFLFQTYSITNNNEVPESLRLVRNVDADPRPGNGGAEIGFAQPGAAYAATNFGNQTGGVFVFAFDSGTGGGADPANSSLNGFAIRPAGGAFGDIVQAGGLPANQINVIAGDGDGDSFTDTAYDLSMALQTDFPSIAPFETVTYQATTFVGDGSPTGQPPLPVQPPGGFDGSIPIPLPGPTPSVTDLAVQPDGKFVVVGTVTQGDGTKDLAVFRVGPDGVVDTTFGNNGLVVTDVSGLGLDDAANAVALQSDGKILIVGTVSDDPNDTTASDYFVTRYNPDGALDTSFGNDAPGLTLADFSDPSSPGTTISDASSIAVASDGSFMVAGTTNALDENGDVAFVRYTANGVPVASFGGGGTGRVITQRGLGESAFGVAFQPDGKIVIAGESDDPNADLLAPKGTLLLARYNPDGSLDTSFGSGGFVTTDVRDSLDAADTVVVLGDGKLLIGGSSSAGSFTVNPDQTISLENFDADFLLARYNPDGSIDTSFGTNGITTTSVPDNLAEATDLLIDPAGRIIAVGVTTSDADALLNGQFGTAIARYLPNGVLDTGFGDGGLTVIPFSQVSGQLGTTSATDTSGLLTAALDAAGVGLAAVQNPGAEIGKQQALIALSAQGQLDILLTSGGQVRLAQVAGDAGAPTATVALLPSVTDAGQTEVTFVIRYEDDFAIDVGTLGNGDILVTDPAGGTTAAELVSVDTTGNGTPRTAIYRYRPAGGAFANGNYALAVAADEVKDTTGRSLAAGPIAGATFAVNILTDGPNLNAAGPVTGKLPASVVGGGKAGGASILVRNTGTQPAVGLIQIRVVASADNVFNDGSDVEVVTLNQKVNLKVGAAKVYKLKFKTFPANVPEGDYFLLARLDNANSIPEMAESDNVGSTATAIHIAPPFVDLGFAGGLSGFKSPLAPGKKGTVAVPLRNNGNVPAKATVSGNLFASLDQAMSGDDRSLGTIPVKANLKASTAKNTKLKFTLPADLAPGQYFLILVLNPAGNDRDPADNTAVSAVPLTVG